MPQIVINGTRIEAAAGKTIIEAALENEMNIPHFCWHPSLSVAGNCRMCLVKVGSYKRMADGNVELDSDGNPIVQFMPKLQIACSTPVADGMVVDLVGDKVHDAQNAVMEFLLINHPLDCPICDEAGQCKLQDYAFNHSKGKSRFDEQKVQKPKRVPLGPNVLFDGERCISCSRCIRFADEVAKQPVLTFVQRGDKVTIETFPGTQFDSDYSMNVIDICPVGALTSIDFRFKTRVWEMSFNDSVCPGCSRGCNISVGVRDNQVLRLEPRTNPHVNTYWMCDYGRLSQYRFVNENRIAEPTVKKDGVHAVASWSEAVAAAGEALKKFKHQEIMVLGSSLASNEDNYLLEKFAHNFLKTTNVDYVRHFDDAFADDMLKTNDKSPNAHGAMEVGVGKHPKGHDLAHLAENIRQGRIKALYVLNEDILSMPDIAAAADSLELIILHASNHNASTQRADIVFPTSTYAECEGTYVNVNKRVQHFAPAVTTKENERYMGMKMSRWDKFGDSHGDRWAQGSRRNCRPAWMALRDVANEFDAGWTYASAEAVFEDLTHHVAGFKGMSYQLLDEFGGLILGKAGEPEPKTILYESHYFKPQAQ